MINRSAYSIDPWVLCETNLDLNVLAQSETLFALSNGHIGLRGNLDEGEPFGSPGSYLNGVYEARPLPYAEAGFGYPEDGQTVINITNAKIMRLLINDEPFDIRYGHLNSHVRSLDFRSGLLERNVEWISPQGHGIRVHSQRLVSLTQRAVAAIVYEVEPIESPLRVVVQSELVTNEVLPPRSRDPRVSEILVSPLAAESHNSSGLNVTLVHQTKASGLRVAVAMDHVAESPSPLQINTESFPDLGRVTFSAALQPGERLRIIKFITYGWSAERSEPAMRDQVEAALAAARQTGWDGLVAEQRATLDEFWERSDIEVDGAPEIQQAARCALFHVFQAGFRAEGRAIPAKGLTGPGYDGHAFWDTEIFVLAVLTYTAPGAVAHALRWRYETLNLAKERAHQLGLKGAAFPWRTITGAECSAYWPAGTAAFHVSADIASAVARYIRATGDEEFARGIGLELLAETARLWRSIGHHDVRGRFCIDGVTGPDEYSAMADNNVYTNLMAQHNLLYAADIAAMYPDDSKRLHIDQEEMAAWRDAAKSMHIPYDSVLKVHPQADDFTNHEVWDFENTSPSQYPLLLHFPYFNLYRKQVVKQADLVLAMHLCPDSFTQEEKARNFVHYEALTVRDSSLSASSQAVIAAEVGYVELAHQYLAETALIDLDDLEHNTREGLHLGACAGTWIALTGGLAGMRERKGTLSFAPRLPEGITRLAFNLTMLGRRLHIEITPDKTTYRLIEGDDFKILHYNKSVRLTNRSAVSRPTEKLVTHGHPTQPRGREPLARRRKN